MTCTVQMNVEMNMDWLLLLAQIFGGCCTNVYLFETLLSSAQSDTKLKDVGTLVTVCQFVLVSLVAVGPLLERTGAWRVRLKKRKIPLLKLFQSVLMFYVSSTLNNSVWRYGLSVPVHIMFRSSGTLITMGVGHVFGGKKYTWRQFWLAVLVSAGAMLAILDMSRETSTSVSGNENMQFFKGILVLFAATVIGAFNGLHTENIYAEYGNNWQEMLFYTHILALPFFSMQASTLLSDLTIMMKSKPNLFESQVFGVSLLRSFAFLLLNCFTQVVCARGVNQLCGMALSLSVTIVLLVRKFVSLAISAYIFENHFSLQGYVGAGVLVLGTIMYSTATLESAKKGRKGPIKAGKKSQEEEVDGKKK